MASESSGRKRVGLWIVTALLLLVAACVTWGLYQKWQFGSARLVGRSANQVLDVLGSPSWAVVFDPYPSKPDVLRVLNDEAIQIVQSGGSGHFIYHRWPFRFGVHFKNGVVTNVADESK